MKLTSYFSKSRKISLAAVSFLSLASLASAAVPYADANPFERVSFGNEWGILGNDIFFGGADALFGLSPASRTLLLFSETESTSTSSSAAIVTDTSREDLSGFASPYGSPFAYSSGGIEPAAITALIEWANVGSTWSDGSNWIGGTAPADSTVTDIAAFGSAGMGPINPNLTLQRNVNGVSFLAGAYSYTVTGSTLIIGSSGISNSATNTQTFSNNLRTSTSQTWTTNAGGTTILNGSVDLNTTTTAARTLTIDGAGNTTFNGPIQNSFAGSTGNLTKNGAGTLVLADANTYNGTTTVNGGILNAAEADSLGGTTNVVVNGGTLLFSNSGTTDRINDTATMTLNGGTFNTDGLSEHGANANDAGIGALTLLSNSIIDLANGASILAFANSSAQTWTGTLSIWNWSGTLLTGDGTDQIYFGNNALGLTPAQLTQISFYSDSGTTFLGTGIWGTDLDGEVVPVPEPSTWIGAALAVLAIGFTQRRRLRGLVARPA